MNEIKSWKFIGGMLCLDFVNSVGGRMVKEGRHLPENVVIRDKLENFKDLVSWEKEIGIITEAEKKYLINLSEKKEAERTFKKAIELRESLFKIIYNVINNKDPEDELIELLNQEYFSANDNRKLIYKDHKIEWQFSKDPLKPDYLIWLVAESAVRLLSSDLISRVKICAGDDCGWLFIDTSKNKSRQWCDMKDCGNLAKVRRFRERQK
ncbi:MAG: CGNR zinc finger domain-containing protein [Ignavibacteriaceae bacterium]